MKHELKILKNKLQTLFVDAPGNTSASVQIWFRAGSALEQEDHFGIAHFLEHMFFKGTKTRPGAAIAHEVESFGGEINAFTSFDYTCYYINTPRNHLSDTIDILLDMVSKPEFLNEDLLPERDVVHEEYRRTIDSSGQYAFLKLQESCFPKGYSHPILGTEKNIKNFTREQVLSFRQKFYNLQNALLVVAGDMKDKEKIQEKIERYQLPSGERSSFPEFQLKKKASVEVHQKETRMATFMLSVQAPFLDSKEAAPEDLAYNCLGHGETSQLYQKLVMENSLANSASASTMFMNKGGVHFLKVSAPVENLAKVFNRTIEVLKDFYTQGVENSELKKIKNQYVASKVYDLESLEAYAFSLGSSFANSGDINSEEVFISQIKAATKDQVNQSIKSLFKRSFHLNVQIPKSASLSETKKLAQKFSQDLHKIAQQPTKAKPKAQQEIKLIKEDPQVQLHQVKPGVQLLYRYNPLTPTFVLHAYIRGGLTEETVETNGQHHLLSSLLTKGNKFNSYEKLKSSLEDMSASLHGFTGKNAYGLTLHGQTEHFPLLATHFTQSLLAPAFNAKLLKHEKQLTLRAIENQKEDPVRTCFQQFSQLVFNNHPYRFNVLGEEKSLKKITAASLSEKHQKNLKSKDILFTYCGDLSYDEVLETLQPLLSSLPNRKTSALKLKKISALKGHFKHISFDREQTHFLHGVPVSKLDTKENTVLKMVTTYLSGQSSPLFVEVRDRQGLCYTAQPVHFNALEGGYWGIYMASGNEKVEAALNAVKTIISQTVAKDLNKTEFLRIKKMIEGQSLLNVQTNDDYANIYSIPVLQGLGLDYYHRSNKEVKELKFEEFKKILTGIFSQKWNTVIVGKEA